MLEGLRTAAAGMQAQQPKLDAVANDLANANTNGYKRLRVGFSDLVYEQGGRPTVSKDAQLGTGAAAMWNGRTFEQGALKNTGVMTDVGLEGQGFMKVKLTDGRQALTRDGDLHIDGKGQLVTSFGAKLGVNDPRRHAGLADRDRHRRHRLRRGQAGRQDRARQRARRRRSSSPSATTPSSSRPSPAARSPRPPATAAQAGHARGVQHGHLAGDDRHDRGPARPTR